MPDNLMGQQGNQPEEKAQESKIPKEFEFLNDPKVKEQLAKVKSEGDYQEDEVRLMMAAQAVGDQIGHENLTDEVMKSLAEYMKQLGLITEIPAMKGKPEEGKEGEAPQEAPKEEVEQVPEEGQPSAPEEEAPVEEPAAPVEEPEPEQEAPQESAEEESAPQEQEQPQGNDREEIVIRRAMKIIETLLRGE
jgi:hypothetical protein